MPLDALTRGRVPALLVLALAHLVRVTLAQPAFPCELQGTWTTTSSVYKGFPKGDGVRVEATCDTSDKVLAFSADGRQANGGMSCPTPADQGDSGSPEYLTVNGRWLAVPDGTSVPTVAWDGSVAQGCVCYYMEETSSAAINAALEFGPVLYGLVVEWAQTCILYRREGNTMTVMADVFSADFLQDPPTWAAAECPQDTEWGDDDAGRSRYRDVLQATGPPQRVRPSRVARAGNDVDELEVLMFEGLAAGDLNSFPVASASTPPQCAAYTNADINVTLTRVGDGTLANVSTLPDLSVDGDGTAGFLDADQQQAITAVAVASMVLLSLTWCACCCMLWSANLRTTHYKRHGRRAGAGGESGGEPHSRLVDDDDDEVRRSAATAAEGDGGGGGAAAGDGSEGGEEGEWGAPAAAAGGDSPLSSTGNGGGASVSDVAAETLEAASGGGGNAKATDVAQAAQDALADLPGPLGLAAAGSVFADDTYIDDRIALNLVLFSMFVHIFSVALVLPALTPLAVDDIFDGSQADASVFLTAMNTVGAVIEFFSNPYLGGMSDVHGRKRFLVMAVACTSVSFFFVGLWPSRGTFVVSAVLRGLTSVAPMVGFTMVVDVSKQESEDPESISKNTGFVLAAAAMGLLLGPVVGGGLGLLDNRIPFLLAGLCEVFNAVYCYAVVPETLKTEGTASFSWRDSNPCRALCLLFKTERLHYLIGIFVLMNFAGSTFTQGALYADFRFGWEALDVGVFLSFVGLVLIVGQILVAVVVIPKLGEMKALMLGISLGIAQMVLLGLSTAGWQWYIIVMATTLAFAASPALRGMIAKEVDRNVQGELQGALASLNTVTNATGPVLASAVFVWATEHLSQGEAEGRGNFDAGAGMLWFYGAFMFVPALVLALVLWRRGFGRRDEHRPAIVVAATDARGVELAEATHIELSGGPGAGV